METVREVKMRLRIKTDHRVLDEEFDNIFEMKTFMDQFFLNTNDRRSGKSNPDYQGPERRIQIQ